MTHHHFQLPNGLTIVGEHSPNALSVALGFFVKTGARDEIADVSGVSHFLEHMMFKGSDKRTPEEVNRDFDALGARYNAFTSEEETVFYGAVLPERGAQLLEILADIMRPALRASDFETEKKVILEEIAMYRDRPISVLFDLLKTRFYNGHALGHSVLGSETSIANLSLEQMKAYFEQRYAANNTTLVVVGNYDWDEIRREAQRWCGDWTSFEAPRRHEPLRPSDGLWLETNRELNRVHIGLMGPGFSTQEAHRWPASVACAALGAGLGSRLYWALVHPGIAEAAQIGHDAQDGIGAFYGVVVATPENAPRALEIYRSEVEKACVEGLSIEEVERAKRRLASSVTLGAETPMGRLRAIGFDWLYRREQVGPDETLERLLCVTAEQVNTVLATRPFAEPAIVALGPIEAL